MSLECQDGLVEVKDCDTKDKVTSTEVKVLDTTESSSSLLIDDPLKIAVTEAHSHDAAAAEQDCTITTASTSEIISELNTELTDTASDQLQNPVEVDVMQTSVLPSGHVESEQPSNASLQKVESSSMEVDSTTERGGLSESSTNNCDHLSIASDLLGSGEHTGITSTDLAVQSTEEESEKTEHASLLTGNSNSEEESEKTECASQLTGNDNSDHLSIASDVPGSGEHTGITSTDLAVQSTEEESEKTEHASQLTGNSNSEEESEKTECASQLTGNNNSSPADGSSDRMDALVDVVNSVTTDDNVDNVSSVSSDGKVKDNFTDSRVKDNLTGHPDTTAAVESTDKELCEEQKMDSDNDRESSLVIVEAPTAIDMEEEDHMESNSDALDQIKITCVQSMASDSTLFEEIGHSFNDEDDAHIQQTDQKNKVGPSSGAAMEVENDADNEECRQEHANTNTDGEATNVKGDLVKRPADVESVQASKVEEDEPCVIKPQNMECEVSSSETFDGSNAKELFDDELEMDEIDTMDVTLLDSESLSSSDVGKTSKTNVTSSEEDLREVTPVKKLTERPTPDNSNTSHPVSTGSDKTGKPVKPFTFNLQKARTMLHSALGTTGITATSQADSGRSVTSPVNTMNPSVTTTAQNKMSNGITTSLPIPQKTQGVSNTPSSDIDKGDSFPLKTEKPDTFLTGGDAQKVASEEPGDILDILKTHSEPNSPSTTQKSDTVAEKTKTSVSNQVARKSTTKNSSSLSKSKKKSEEQVKIKVEPSEDYDVNVYGSMYTDTDSVLQTRTSRVPSSSAPKVVIENVASTESSRTQNSLQQLSNQVNRLPVSVAQSLWRSDSQKTSPVPSTTVRWPAPQTKTVGPSPANIRTTAPTGVGTLTSTSANTVTVSSSVASLSSTRFVPIMMGGKSSNAKTVTIKFNNIAPASTIVPTSTVIMTPKPSQQTLPPKISVAAPRSKVETLTTPALLQNNAKVKTITPAALSFSSINIDTVGLPKITELIARKNPIPNYKPSPVPENLKTIVKGVTHVCYECGDNFAFLNSLKQHRSRYSMKITYKCDDCKQEKNFFNKCQFLGHLRQHLNIEKTQAVPIHIKSDSISILPLPKIYEHLVFPSGTVQTTCSQTSSETTSSVVDPPSSSKRCRECGLLFSLESIDSHFVGKNMNCDFRHCCSICHMCLPSICSLRAHRRLHRSEPPFVCPECGESFVKLLSNVETNSPETSLALHLKTKCYHVNRLVVKECPKCNECLEYNQFKSHLFEKVDQYLKCLSCPMAFKSNTAMQNHAEAHKDDGKKATNKPQFKMIYRCHVCDSVMDDLNVLEMHTGRHLTVMRQTAVYRFKCLYCYKRFFDTKEQLQAHIKSSHKEVEVSLSECTKCMKVFPSVLDSVVHTMVFHRCAEQIEFTTCKKCCRVLTAQEFIEHTCNEKRAQKVFDCNFCKAEIKTKSKLLKHMEKHRKNGKLICLKCYKIGFKDDFQLALHESACQMDQPEPTYVCSECGLKFPAPADLDKHCQKEHPFQFSKLYPCHLCEHAYESEEELQRHVKIKHEAKRAFFPCEICKSRNIKRIFSNKVLLEKHLTSRHRIGRHHLVQDEPVSDNEMEEISYVNENEVKQDPDCSSPSSVGSPVERAAKRKSEERHFDRPIKRLHVEGESSFKCAKCNYSCDSRQTFISHLVIHKVDSNYLQCLECGLSFAVIPSLKKHLFMVHKIKDFEAYCKENNIVEIIDVDDDAEIRDVPPMPMEVKDESHKEDMSESDDNVERNPLECRVCHKMFESEAATNSHMRTHGMAFIRNKKRTLSSRPLVNGDSSDSSLSSAPALSQGEDASVVKSQNH